MHRPGCSVSVLEGEVCPQDPQCLLLERQRLESVLLVGSDAFGHSTSTVFNKSVATLDKYCEALDVTSFVQHVLS